MKGDARSRIEPEESVEATPRLHQVWQDRNWPQSRIDRMLGGAPSPAFPEDYVHVADVMAASLVEAVASTTHIGSLLDPHGDPPYRPWHGNEGVKVLVPSPYSRETDVGDVIVDPSDRPFRVEREGFTPIDRLEAQSARSPGDIVIVRDGGGAETHHREAPSRRRS